MGTSIELFTGDSNDIEKLKEEIKLWKSRYESSEEHFKDLDKHWQALYNEILPEGWYCMASDCWGERDEILSACKERLHRSFVQRIIKKNKF